MVAAFTREAPANSVDQNIEGEQAVVTCRGITSARGLPKAIGGDDGPEFISKALNCWACENGVTLDFS